MYAMTSTHDRLLDAARAILAEHGLAGLSVRKVAADAGVSPMAMYRHFEDKDALIDALMEDGLATWEKTLAGVKARAPTRWIERTCEAFIEFAITDPHRFEAAFLLPARGARKYPSALEKPSPVLAMIIAKLQEQESRGGRFQLPIERILPMLSAIMFGMVALYRSGRLPSAGDLRKLSRTAVSDLLSVTTTGRPK
jgi:AcrR family transcriptional regulator